MALMSPAKPLLILDLDETLVHGREVPLARAPDFTAGPYSLYRRPGVARFLQQMAQHYALAVWTSSSPSYARLVVAQLFADPDRLAFVWASDRCTPRRDFDTDTWWQCKSLHKVKRRGYDLDRVLAIDDNPEKYQRSYGNLVAVEPFEGDPQDEELALLGSYLQRLAAEPNLRRIEKRWWRRQAMQARSGELPGLG